MVMRNTLESDALRNFKFLVEVQHVVPNYGSMARIGFMSATGLGATTEPISYREGGDNTTPRKMPGQTDFGPITLTRGLFVSQADPVFAWQWFREIFFVNYGQGLGGPANDFRASVIIKLLEHPITNPQAIAGAQGGLSGPHTAKVAWKLFNAWPASLAFSDMDAGGNGIVVSQMTLVHEGFDMKGAAGPGNYLPTNPW